jgi:hypothetical protein
MAIVPESLYITTSGATQGDHALGLQRRDVWSETLTDEDLR